MENDLPLSGDTASAATTEVVQEVVAEEVITEAETPSETDETESNDTEDGEVEKPKKTPEQLEINRLRKATARLTRQREEARAQLAVTQANTVNTVQETDDSETLSLTRAELNEFVNKQAQQLAPIIQQQQAQARQREAVLSGLEKKLGQQGLATLSENLEDAFNGLDDGRGNLKPVFDAVFYADDPQAIIEYLGDPDNFEEAEAFSAMNLTQAGRAIGKIEGKLEAFKKEKPKPSNASKPLEAVKGSGTIKGMPDPSNTKAYIAWANEQEAR